MIYMFDGRLAVAIGLTESIIMMYLAQRPKSLQNEEYPTKTAFRWDLPFSSEVTVDRAMKRLKKAGYINIIPSDTLKYGFKVVLTGMGLNAISDPYSAYIPED